MAAKGGGGSGGGSGSVERCSFSLAAVAEVCISAVVSVLPICYCCYWVKRRGRGRSGWKRGEEGIS